MVLKPQNDHKPPTHRWGFFIFGILKNITYICDKSSLPWNIQKI